MFRTISLGISLYILWLLLSGHYSILPLSLGLASCLLVVYLSHRMKLIGSESNAIHLSPRFIKYLPWLLLKIIQSNLDVCKQILSPRPLLTPVRFKLSCSQKSDLGRVIYANSITLTPGTLTIDTTDNIIEVHALSEAAAQDLQSGEMDRRVTDLMRES